MPPKSKNKPTPMLMFMNEKREQMEKEHKKKFKFPFDEDLYVLCKPFYNELSEEQKQHYKDLAKAEWTGNKDEENKKLTSGGKSVSLIQKQEQENLLKKKVEHMEIEKQFNFDTHVILPIEIVVIHVNWFCKENENSYVPAELGLAKFSLQYGLLDYYHCFPFHDFPPGTKAVSKSHSNKTHQIPVFEFSEKTEKLAAIFRDVIRFLCKNKQEPSSLQDTCFPLYTMNDDVSDITSRNAVRSFLNSIVTEANYDDTPCENPHEKYFKLYDLSKLMHVLVLRDPFITANVADLFGVQVMDNLLRQDMYLQSHSIACKWHDERDLIPKCSLARCISWVYIICERLKFLGYAMIPGKHMPDNVVLVEYECAEKPSSSHSSYNADDEEEEF